MHGKGLPDHVRAKTRWILDLLAQESWGLHNNMFRKKPGTFELLYTLTYKQLAKGMLSDIPNFYIDDDDEMMMMMMMMIYI